MEPLKPLSDFFEAIKKDERISIVHIGLYAALLQFRADNGFINPILVYRSEIIAIAKIYSPKTYHKCMRQLNEYGYIRYEPTHNKYKRSKIYFFSSTSELGLKLQK
ncbi:hypothetical protein OIU83_01545 [Flavobacterium sp. LS1R49]|uniref:Helix-turn-helix domain-containing protein n=1 Tax=Flavobacterium shii TaxID=2987687 RepID=A0A9X3BWY5_9FLAO|nr:hypothetical protein [Flavobacterium shii]